MAPLPSPDHLEGQAKREPPFPPIEFDWQAVYQALGEHEPESIGPDYEAMSDALRNLFDWLLAVNLDGRNPARAAGLRLMALAWVMNPDRFDGASLRKLTRSMGVSAGRFSTLAAEVRRTFRLSNPFQKHDWRAK
jgi:hypothetical protein